MGAISPQYFALGVGLSGALVDVSAYVTGASDGVSRRYGQLDSFRDATPGTFTVVLDNYDGRFTPENTVANAAAGYSTTDTEGMAACVQIGSRLTAGQVIGIRPLLGSDWGRIQITCDDALGTLGRRQLINGLSYESALTNAVVFYPFNEPAGSASGVDVVTGSSYWADRDSTSVFGTQDPRAVPGMPETWVAVTCPAAFSPALFVPYGVVPTGSYAANSLGCTSVWVDCSDSTNSTDLDFAIGGQQAELKIARDTVTISVGTVAVTSQFLVDNGTAPHFYAVEWTYTGTTLTGTLYRDSVLLGSATKTGLTLSNPTFSAYRFQVFSDMVVPNTVLIAELAQSTSRPLSNFAASTTIGNRISAVAQTAGVTSSVTDLQTAGPLARADAAGQPALNVLNDVLRTEQGYAYPVTTGTLTSNSETLVIRGRTRPTTVTASFDAVTELANAPEFIRDVTNLVSSTQVSSPDQSVLVTDRSLIARADYKNDSDYTVLQNVSDLSLWGQDRLQRGGLVSLRLASLVIDAMTTPTDRSADLLGLVPGDRIRVTNLPDDVLGFTEWDGWVVGGEETHNPTMNRFTFSLAPVLPPVPVFNAARYAAGTSLTLSSTINNSVTSISIATTDATFTTDSTDLPVNILIDSEEMTVTAVSSATPQVFTVTRGANGTTAASHSSGVQVELADVEPSTDATVEVNYITKPSVETSLTGYATVVGTSGWAATTVRNNAGAAYAGTYRAVATCTTASSSAGGGIGYTQQGMSSVLTLGDSWTFSGYMRTNLAAQRMVCQVDWLDSGGSTISSTTGTAVIISSSLSPAFTQAAVTSTVPASADGWRLRFISAAGTSFVNWSVGDALVLDGLRAGSSALYFDGSSVSSSSVMYSWADVAQESWSYELTGGQVQPATFGF